MAHGSNNPGDAGAAGGLGPADLRVAVCATHPGRTAGQLCQRCGDFMCSLCATWADGGQYCPRCFDLLYQRGALSVSRCRARWPTLAMLARSFRQNSAITVAGTLVALTVLAGIVLPSFIDRSGGGIQTTRTQLGNFRSVIQLYTMDYGVPPTTQQGLGALTMPSLAGQYPYLEMIPADEWGYKYRYESPGPSGEPFRVTSYGGDGKPGGEGFDADLTTSD